MRKLFLYNTLNDLHLQYMSVIRFTVKRIFYIYRKATI